MKKVFVKLFSLACLLCILSLCGCKKSSSRKGIAVFVPGICDDSPVYAMLVQGVKNAVNEFNQKNSTNVDLFIMEAGTNQAEWATKLTALAAEQRFDVIISSNPSLPDLAVPILEQFPSQKFILLDATLEGNKNIHTVRYNQYEQSYLTGYIGSLMSKNHKLGLIAAQEYPVMNNIILPFFTKGAQDAYNDTSVDFRIVGNWYDATKGAEIADALYTKGVDVILPICGGAAQGVIKSAVNNGIYITWFDNNGFERAPGTIISSTMMEQVQMSQNVTTDFLEGKTQWGQAKMVGIKEGFVSFVEDDINYINTVPSEIREKMHTIIEEIKSGKRVIQ